MNYNLKHTVVTLLFLVSVGCYLSPCNAQNKLKWSEVGVNYTGHFSKYQLSKENTISTLHNTFFKTALNQTVNASFYAAYNRNLSLFLQPGVQLNQYQVDLQLMDVKYKLHLNSAQLGIGLKYATFNEVVNFGAELAIIPRVKMSQYQFNYGSNGERLPRIKTMYEANVFNVSLQSNLFVQAALNSKNVVRLGFNINQHVLNTFKQVDERKIPVLGFSFSLLHSLVD